MKRSSLCYLPVALSGMSQERESISNGSLVCYLVGTYLFSPVLYQLYLIYLSTEGPLGELLIIGIRLKIRKFLSEGLFLISF